jgi:hypothetical protein
MQAAANPDSPITHIPTERVYTKHKIIKNMKEEMQLVFQIQK